MEAWVYILRCGDGSLYVGLTTALDFRLDRHRNARTPGYTSARLPVVLAYSEHCPDVATARKRERQIKRWTHAKKEALIVGDLDLLRRL